MRLCSVERRGNDALTIAAGATGNDVLIGNGPFDSLTDNGSGYDIVIGAGWRRHPHREWQRYFDKRDDAL